MWRWRCWWAVLDESGVVMEVAVVMQVVVEEEEEEERVQISRANAVPLCSVTKGTRKLRYTGPSPEDGIRFCPGHLHLVIRPRVHHPPPLHPPLIPARSACVTAPTRWEDCQMLSIRTLSPCGGGGPICLLLGKVRGSLYRGPASQMINR
ncbi:unnamed protein product [Merluccius merluccius]